MTTLYGTTSFAYSKDPFKAIRTLDVTDPLGGRERFVAHAGTHEGTLPDTDSIVPEGFRFFNLGLNAGFSAYWDRRAMSVAPGDFTQAKITNWFWTGNSSAGRTLSVKKAEKLPLENRVWYSYPGAVWTFGGNISMALPDRIARVLGDDDGTTQLWSYEYNLQGQLTRAVEPDGHERTYAYAANGVDLLEVQRADSAGVLGVVETRTYRPEDPPHLPATITNALGDTTTFTYNADGQVTTVANPKNETTSFSYSSDGHLIAVTGPGPGAAPGGGGGGGDADPPATPGAAGDADPPAPGPSVTRFTYDRFGRVRTVTDPTGYLVTTDYDALDRPLRVRYPDGTYEQIVYNRLDPERRRDRLGRWSETLHDRLRRPTVMRDTAGHLTRFEWCPCGGLDKLIDANGNATSWTRDLQGRITRETRADGTFSDYTYESTTSRLKSRRDRRGQVTTYAYDIQDRLIGKTYTDGTPPVSYSYDHRGRLASAANGTDTLTWRYDGADRMTSETSAFNGSTVLYGYDAAGNRRTLDLDGQVTSYRYDGAGRLIRITRGTQEFGFTYDQASRRTSMTYPNGVVTSYEYDDASRLTRLRASKGSITITDFQYTYDAMDNRTRKATPELIEDYAYDALDQLTGVRRAGVGAAQWRYSYDPVGNRTGEQVDGVVTGATHDNMNRLLQRAAGDGPLTFAGRVSEPATVAVQGQPARVTPERKFAGEAAVPAGTSTVDVSATDASGHTRTNTYEVAQGTGVTATYTYDANGNLATKVEDGVTWTYAWNAENQLIRVTKGGAEVARFAYDPKGRRVAKIAAGMTTSYTYDGEDILREAVSSGTTSRYVHGPGTDEPVARGVNGSHTYYHADGLGGVVRMTDATGTATSTRRYDAWGQMQVGAEDAGYAYTGREWDPESGLYYYRARYYDAEVGLFVSEDPIKWFGGRHFYAYASNNPATLIDPLGLKSTDPPGCGGGSKCPQETENKGKRACKKIEKDPRAPECLKRGCRNLKIRCNSDPKTCTHYVHDTRKRTHVLGKTHGTGDVHLCPGHRGCQSVLHELAHECYDDEQTVNNAVDNYDRKYCDSNK